LNREEHISQASSVYVGCLFVSLLSLCCLDKMRERERERERRRCFAPSTPNEIATSACVFCFFSETRKLKERERGEKGEREERRRRRGEVKRILRVALEEREKLG
jgi:hypothetical protein